MTKTFHGGHTFCSSDKFPEGTLYVKQYVIDLVLSEDHFFLMNAAKIVAAEPVEHWIGSNVYPIHQLTIVKIFNMKREQWMTTIRKKFKTIICCKRMSQKLVLCQIFNMTTEQWMTTLTKKFKTIICCKRKPVYESKVGFMSFFIAFAGSNVLIQCMSTTTLSLSNQTFHWSNKALQIVDALLDEYQWCFYRVLNCKPFAPKHATLPPHHDGFSDVEKLFDIFWEDNQQRRELEKKYRLQMTQDDFLFYEDQKGLREARCLHLEEPPTSSDF